MQKVRGHRTNPAPTVCRHMVSGSISPPSSGCFSPFPHGTCSLSVIREYLALEDGPPRFPRDFTCPTVLRNITGLLPVSCTGVSPSLPCLPRHFHYLPQCRCVSPTTPHEHARTVWAVPRSLATTWGVSIDFLSCGYLDVSVPRVGSFR